MARFICIFSLGFCVLLSAPIFAESATEAADKGSVQIKDTSAGARLYVMHKCYECHRAQKHHIGPSWQAISQRYSKEEDKARLVARLSVKVIEGGYGNWGTLPMNSNPGVSPEDASTLVEWVLETN